MVSFAHAYGGVSRNVHDLINVAKVYSINVPSYRGYEPGLSIRECAIHFALHDLAESNSSA